MANITEKKKYDANKKQRASVIGCPMPDRIMKSLIFQAESYEASCYETLFYRFQILSD